LALSARSDCGGYCSRVEKVIGHGHARQALLKLIEAGEYPELLKFHKPLKLAKVEKEEDGWFSLDGWDYNPTSHLFIKSFEVPPFIFHFRGRFVFSEKGGWKAEVTNIQRAFLAK
jgi:hypothetical protein